MFGFVCPCYPESPTYFVKKCYGVSTARVPLALMDI
jgi:hypothetical protein